MKRLNRFFAILFAVLGVSSLSAQTWMPSDVAPGTYYIYNVGAKKFMCSGNNWGSHASVTEGGIPLTLAGSGNFYTISTADIYKDKYLSSEWMDGGSYNWTFESVGNGVYKIKNGSNVLFWNGGTSTNTTLGTDPGTEAAQWMLVTEENRISAMASATEGNPVDATFLIKNAYFAKGNGSYFGKDLANSNSWKGTTFTDFGGIDKNGEDACYAVEQYGKSFDNYQELNVPNGKYFLTAKGFYRGNVIPYIYANSEKCNLKQKGDIGGDNIGNGAKAMLGDAYLLDGVNVVVTDGKLRVGVKSDASIDWCVFDDFKLVYYGTPYNNALVKVNELIALCENYADKTSEFNTALNNAKNEIEQASSVEAVKNVYFSLEIARQTFLNPQLWSGATVGNGDYYLYNIGSKKYFAAGNSWGTRSSLNDNAIRCTLAASGDNYTISTTSGWNNCYLGSNGFVDNGAAWPLKFTNVCNNIYTISSGDNYLGYNGSSSEMAINITDEMSANALWILLTKESIISDMVTKATQEQGLAIPFIMNSGFSRNHTLHWKNTDKAPGVGGDNDNFAGEIYNGKSDVYQELSGLPNGVYELVCQGFYRMGNVANAASKHNAGAEELNAKIYINNEESSLMSIMEEAGKLEIGTSSDLGYVPNSMGDMSKWFNEGYYDNNKVRVNVTDGNLRLGVKKSVTVSGDWTGFDNFRLIYYGIDLTDIKTTLANDLQRANILSGSKMGVAARIQLESAIEGVDANSSNLDELKRMISELQIAITVAENSIADYAKIKTFIDKANKIDESIAASYQAQYDNGTIEGSVEDVFQALEVATYNYVKDNFTYDVALSDTWNSTGTNTKAATFSNEHWSGETREYMNQDDNNGQGWNANSWTIDFDQDVTLPAGEYVFKVAGRKSADATLELNVTKGETILGTVNDFPSSNNALGINKAGAASFDAEDQAGFANNGNGFGWQWRYVKFTLAEKSTVKVAIHAETDKVQNWVSFGDYTLQMTEETYMAAGQPELEAALSAAQALVGTKPMGTDEETALTDAIALPVTTGAEQKAKVNALNTAVANANAWRTVYYAEKDKLVAQLERFETDYNDAENGSLDYMYMNKKRWATVIEKAQAAAVAKDNQTNHKVLTDATDELKAALDAATVSVGEYAALKSVIGEANSLVGANVGDQPFEKPQSAADAINTTDEQALYDAATADGEGVTSVTAALKEGIATFNNTPLNAPKDGARYNLVLNNNYGWTYDGKAVTYLANDRPDMGLYNIQYLSAVNANYAQAFSFTAVDGQQDCYYISMTDVDGNERYVSTGVPYGGNANQIRTTINAEDALAVKVIATKTDGVHNLYNVEANNYIGSQDAGFYTVNSHINFNIQEASTVDVTLNISSAKWSTLILPFNAELPEGVKAHACAGVIDGVLNFNEATTIVVANTPYLVGGNAGKYDFSGYGLADKDSYTDGLFTGTYVDYQTEANKGIYVLQNHDNVVAFYLVGEGAKPRVRANRCYITYEEVSGARMLRLGFGDDDTTGIDNMQFPTDNSGVTIYDTMGRKVTSMKKGNLYIMNGRKVVVK